MYDFGTYIDTKNVVATRLSALVTIYKPRLHKRLEYQQGITTGLQPTGWKRTLGR
jgi:hypothetical protein